MLKVLPVPVLRAMDKFALDPAPQLGGGKFYTMADQAMFGAVGYSSPDKWERLLMRRKAARDGSPALLNWTSFCPSHIESSNSIIRLALIG